MQILRTILWVAALLVLLFFTAYNWKPVEVQIWQNTVLETKLPALVIAAFLLGLVPTWLVHRGLKWRLQRRIHHLETATRSMSQRSEATPVNRPVYTPKTGGSA